MSEFWIRGARLIDPRSGTDGLRDIWIRDGKIERIAEPGGLPFGGKAAGREADREGIAREASLENGAEIIDASGLAAAPGLVDVHVHFRDPGFLEKEDICTGAAAAARGGYTSVVMMANTNPPVDNIETLRYMLEKGAETPVHVYACANVTVGMKGKILTEMPELKEAGAIGFTDDGLPLTDAELVREAMRRTGALHVPISFHEEDPALIGAKENNGINRGRASEHFAHLGTQGSPREAEVSLIRRDLELAEELLRTEGIRARIDIQHISTREGVELVRRAKAAGLDVHAEATPHHFTLTEDAAITYGTLAKMNPPLRTEEDRLAIIQGLADGTIDLIATDHAPHTAEEKAQELPKAPSGIIGLETALGLGITELTGKGYLTLSQLIERMSDAPARVYGLDAGYLAESGPADLVLFDPEEEWEVRGEEFTSKARNTPFLGRKLKGRVRLTICKGEIV